MDQVLRQDVIEEIIRHTNPDSGAFLVGGQALNFWAERYSPQASELAYFGPYVSKDIDFFGGRHAAAKLAAALGGTVSYPPAGDHSPNSAIVSACVLGEKIKIDFLWSIAGTPTDKLEQQAVVIGYQIQSGASQSVVPLKIMHPLHCLQSRAANVITLGRRDNTSKRQLDAAPIILREYISEALGNEPDVHRARVAASILKGLAHYLTSNPVGARYDQFSASNPLDTIRAFANDDRFDPRFRDNQLKNMIDEVSARQALNRKRQAMAAAKGPVLDS